MVAVHDVRVHDSRVNEYLTSAHPTPSRRQGQSFNADLKGKQGRRFINLQLKGKRAAGASPLPGNLAGASKMVKNAKRMLYIER